MPQIFKLTIEFYSAEERDKYLTRFKKQKERRLNKEWYHHLTRAFLYENPDIDMPYKEAFEMIKNHYN